MYIFLHQKQGLTTKGNKVFSCKQGPQFRIKQQWDNNRRFLVFLHTMCVCIHIETGDFNNRGTIVAGWGGVHGFILCTKPMRTSLKKNQCPNNGRTMRDPRLKVFTHVILCDIQSVDLRTKDVHTV